MNKRRSVKLQPQATTLYLITLWLKKGLDPVGQVPKSNPPHYALIGSGRVARHFKYYLEETGHQLACWSRNDDSNFNTLPVDEYSNSQARLAATLADTTHVLLAIKDSALKTWIHNPLFNGKVMIHFSGAHHYSQAHGAHPLMTFGQSLYPIETYVKIAFVCEQGHMSFHQLFPDLANPSYVLDPTLKPLYHALCVAAGNFSQLLWQSVLAQAEQRLHLPAEAFGPYLEQTFKNLLQDPQHALTGPLMRRDWDTVQRNLTALQGHPLRKVYSSFVELGLEANEHT